MNLCFIDFTESVLHFVVLKTRGLNITGIGAGKCRASQGREWGAGAAQTGRRKWGGMSGGPGTKGAMWQETRRAMKPSDERSLIQPPSESGEPVPSTCHLGKGKGVHPGVCPACWSPLLSCTKLHRLEGNACILFYFFL